MQTLPRVQSNYVCPIPQTIPRINTTGTKRTHTLNLNNISLNQRFNSEHYHGPDSPNNLSSSPASQRVRTTHYEPSRFRSQSLTRQKKCRGCADHSHKPVEWAFMDEPLPRFPTESKSLRVLAFTWNLKGKKPKDGLETLLNMNRVKHHIISIGTEECLRSIAASAIYHSKSRWVNLLRMHLDKEYIMIKSHSMNALHLTVFVHRSIYDYVRGVESSEVRTGLGNIMGNKGGIGISAKIYGVSFLFINCHLTSGQTRYKQRNQDFERIIYELELPEARVAQEKKLKQRSTILDRFDCIFWSGDFNYRVNKENWSALECIRKNNMSVLLNADQLSIEKRCNRLLGNFLEGQIMFPPTYKYQVDSHLLDHKKERTPSWTDRILYRYKDPNVTVINQLTYQSIHCVTTSDHKPVMSQFLVTMPENAPKRMENGFVRMKSNSCKMF